MAEYFKEPQNPLKKIDEKTGDITYVYPMTTAKQVIMDDDGTRLNTILNENILYLGDAEDDMNVAPVDADTLGGVVAEEYATKEYVNSNGISTYIHSTGTLTGLGENGKFKATVSETVSSITVNGTACSVNCGGENSIELVKDCWYTFILDGTSINFKAGGGVSNSKLALTTAAAGDVLSGKTFYSGNKKIKTGTIPSKGAATYGAKTSAQTISAGQYLSGAQTIAAVTQSGLNAADIRKGKTVTISSNGSNLWNITGTLISTAGTSFKAYTRTGTIPNLVVGKRYLITIATNYNRTITFNNCNIIASFTTQGNTTNGTSDKIEANYGSYCAWHFIVEPTSTSITQSGGDTWYQDISVLALN